MCVVFTEFDIASVIAKCRCRLIVRVPISCVNQQTPEMYGLFLWSSDNSDNSPSVLIARQAVVSPFPGFRTSGRKEDMSSCAFPGIRVICAIRVGTACGFFSVLVRDSGTQGCILGNAAGNLCALQSARFGFSASLLSTPIGSTSICQINEASYRSTLDAARSFPSATSTSFGTIGAAVLHSEPI